jgi:hypothetical protein
LPGPASFGVAPGRFPGGGVGEAADDEKDPKPPTMKKTGMTWKIQVAI